MTQHTTTANNAIESSLDFHDLAMTASDAQEPDVLLLPSEVAALFRVDPKTVTRWANTGRISAVRTLGGHRRFRESEILAILNGEAPPAPTRYRPIPTQRRVR